MKTQIAALVILPFLLVTVLDAQWTPDPFCPYPSDHVTRYLYYGNCSVFWECYEGAKYVMECPEGLEFNAPLQQCDAPEIANCDPYASTTNIPNRTTGTGSSDATRTTVISTTPGIYPECPNTDELVYFPYEGDCTKYWECYAGSRYLYVCPSGLWWHQEISECDYPGTFCINITTTPPTIIPTTGGNDPRCTQGGTTYWPQPGDCSKFVECVDGVSYIVDCSQGVYFSDRVKDCVRAEESECCEEYECTSSV